MKKPTDCNKHDNQVKIYREYMDSKKTSIETFKLCDNICVDTCDIREDCSDRILKILKNK